MVVGILQLALRLPGVHSLKEKRGLIKSLMTRIRNRFNVSVSEVDRQDSWQSATLAIAHVGNARDFTNKVLDEVVNFTTKEKSLEVVDSHLELI